MQDLDAGVIMGSGRTFGKGLVQTINQAPMSTVRMGGGGGFNALFVPFFDFFIGHFSQ